MRRSSILFMALLVFAASAKAQNIGLFFDSRGAPTCNGSAVPGFITMMYIMASLGGGAGGGLTGAEFRVTGMPAEWTLNVVANPAANIVLGNPFNGSGVSETFPACQTGPIVLLFTVEILPSTIVSNLHLRVEHLNPPLNVNLTCPLMTNCVSPDFTKVCTTGGTGILNPTGPGCTVGVEASSWTQVKSLYEGR